MLSWKLLTVSFLSFLIVNLLENILYYNLGKHSIQEFQISLPTPIEIIMILLIMFVFAGIQSLIISYYG
jgi:hypothetical protein